MQHIIRKKKKLKARSRIRTGEDPRGLGEAETCAGDEVSAVIIIGKCPKRGARLLGAGNQERRRRRTVGSSGEDLIQGPGAVEIEIQVHEDIGGAAAGVILGVGGHFLSLERRGSCVEGRERGRVS